MVEAGGPQGEDCLAALTGRQCLLAAEPARLLIVVLE